MKTARSVAIAVGILFATAFLVEDAALARSQASPAQLLDKADGETKVAQRKARKKGASRGEARARSAGKGKRSGAKAGTAQRPPAPPPPSGDDAEDHSPIVSTRTGPARVDFDERLVQGQSSKSGAIYIFERKGAELRTMVRRRQSFREEILRTVE